VVVAVLGRRLQVVQLLGQAVHVGLAGLDLRAQLGLQDRHGHGHEHLPDALVDGRVRRQGCQLAVGQLRQADVALPPCELRPRDADLLLRGDRSGLDLADELVRTHEGKWVRRLC